MEKPNVLFGRILPIAFLAAGLALSGCMQPKEKEVVASSVPVLPDLPSVRFKSPDPYIDVFPGTGDSKSDKTPNGYYGAGQSRLVTCWQEGRSDGTTSVIWYQIYRPDGLRQYVSAAHVDLVPANANIPHC